VLLVALVILAGILAWAPWLSAPAAEEKAVAAFEAEWAGVVDGCGFNCDGCGAVESRWKPFGFEVTLEYACGLLPSGTAGTHQRAVVRVGPFGNVSGIPGS
jgi:hypothetical protein